MTVAKSTKRLPLQCTEINSVVNLLDSFFEQYLRGKPLSVPAHSLTVDGVTVKLMDHERINLLVFEVRDESMPEGMEGLLFPEPAAFFVPAKPFACSLTITIP